MAAGLRELCPGESPTRAPLAASPSSVLASQRWRQHPSGNCPTFFLFPLFFLLSVCCFPFPAPSSVSEIIFFLLCSSYPCASTILSITASAFIFNYLILKNREQQSSKSQINFGPRRPSLSGLSRFWVSYCLSVIFRYSPPV